MIAILKAVQRIDKTLIQKKELTKHLFKRIDILPVLISLLSLTHYIYNLFRIPQSFTLHPQILKSFFIKGH